MKGGRKGICPKFWGPYAWKLLHYMSFRLNKQGDIERFYSSIQYLLPCSKCRKNYREHLLNLPIPKKNYDKWVYDLHNRVNTSLNVEIKPPTFKEVKQKYKDEPVDKSVWLFVRCILNTHPGVREITEEYIKAIEDFISLFAREIDITELPANYKSRTVLKKWYEHHVPEMEKTMIKMCNKECLDE